MFGTVEKKVLEKLPDGVFVFDNKLRVKFMNAAFRRSFFIDGKVANPSEEWKHIRIDITPHLERCISVANKDNTFGKEVTMEDFYFKGCNVGFEVHGNFDCTFEIKNFNLVSYSHK